MSSKEQLIKQNNQILNYEHIHLANLQDVKVGIVRVRIYFNLYIRDFCRYCVSLLIKKVPS